MWDEYTLDVDPRGWPEFLVRLVSSRTIRLRFIRMRRWSRPRVRLTADLHIRTESSKVRAANMLPWAIAWPAHQQATPGLISQYLKHPCVFPGMRHAFVQAGVQQAELFRCHVRCTAPVGPA